MFGEGHGDILMDSVNCNDSESHIGDCLYNGLASTECFHHEDAGVKCFGGTTLPGNVYPSIAQWSN